MHTNIVTSVIFGTNKMITSNINDANVMVIALGNTSPKKANTNRMTIVHSNVVPIRLDVYVTAIEW